MVQKGQSHRNRAELSSWAEAQPFKHPSLGLCPKLSSFMLQLQRVCPGASSSQPHRQRRFGEGDPQTALLDCCSDGGTEGAKQGEQALPGLPWVPKRACTSAQHSSRLIAGVQCGLKGLQPGAELLQSKVTSTAHPKLWKITLPTLPGCRQRGWELQSPPPQPAPVSSVLPVLQEEAPGAAPVAGACMVSGRADATHPQLADESACLLHRQLALLPHDALNGLEDVPGHGDIPTDVDVASLLLQCFEHGLGQLLL